MKLGYYFKRFFLSEHIMLGLIILNSITIFLEESGIVNQYIYYIDLACTLAFIVEMVIKIGHFGWSAYWSRIWNKLDGFLVIASLPSVIALFIPQASILDISIVLIFRVLRVLRFFRLFRIFPNFETIGRNFWKAMKDSTSIFFCFLLLVVIWAMFTCFMFRNISPEYFATPIDSIYSIFRLCTIEGWYEIPDSICTQVSPFIGYAVKSYFITIVVFGGVIGISLVNSVFVDAMVSDNNDPLEKKVDNLQQKLDQIEKLLKDNINK